MFIQLLLLRISLVIGFIMSVHGWEGGEEEGQNRIQQNDQEH